MKKILFYTSAAALLVSCAKELVEEPVVLPVEGESTIVASYEVDAETRTYMDKAGNFSWEVGDAIGVFAAEENDAVNAIFKYNESKKTFTGDLNKFKAEIEDFYAYYPWSSNQQIKGNTLSLELPAVQYYNHEELEATKEFGSPSQASIPAVAKALGVTDRTEPIEMTFKPVVSYIRIPVIGDGTVETVTMKVKIGEQYYKLNGTIDVNFEDKEDDEFFTLEGVGDLYVVGNEEGNINESDATLTLNCGVGVPLDSKTPKYFWFIVPADFNLKPGTQAATFEISINDKNYVRSYSSAGIVPRNKWFDVKPSGETAFWYSDDDYYVIQDAQHFVEYAYASSVSGGFAMAPDAMKTGSNLKSALITEDINFASYTPAKNNAFQTAVAEWYVANGNAINTIGLVKKYDIRGAQLATEEETTAIVVSEEGKAPILTGLKVKGNGIFDDGFKNNTYTRNSVNNIVLNGVTIDAPGVTGNVNVLTNRLRTTSSNKNANSIATRIEKVTVTGKVNVNNATPDAKVALIGRAFTDDIANVTIKNETDITYVNELNVFNPKVKFVKEPASAVAEDEIPVVTVSYNQIDIHENFIGAILYVEDGSHAAEIMGAVKEGNKNWYSVLDAKTSYYTGLPATSATNVNDTAIFTAEELAKTVKEGGNVTLTNDIEIGYAKTWPASSGNEVTVDGKGDYTISRVTIGENGLFGSKATVSDLTIEHVFVNGTYVLANTGTAKNVTAKNLNYKNNNLTGILAGLFYQADVKTVNETVNCTVDARNVPDAAKFGALYGVVNVNLGGVVNFKENAGNKMGSEHPFGSFLCSADADLSDSQTAIYVKDYTENTVPTSIVSFAGVIKEGYEVVLHWADNKYSDTIVYHLGENVKDDLTLSAAIAAAENANEENPVTINVQAGTYTSLPQPANEFITIDCEDGTVFNGSLRGDLNGATIKNARFTNDNVTNNENPYPSGSVYGKINGTFIDCIFEGTNALYYCNAGEKVEFTGCTFIGNGTYAAHMDKGSVSGSSVTFTKCVFDGFVALAAEPVFAFYGCTFKVNDKSTFGGGNFRGSSIFTGCEFTLGDYTNDRSFQWIDCSNGDNDQTKIHTFTNCTVKGQPLTDSYKFRVSDKMTSGINITIDGHNYHFDPNNQD